MHDEALERVGAEGGADRDIGSIAAACHHDAADARRVVAGIEGVPAAAEIDPEVDTIFEIGGQDSKYIHLRNGVPVDYAMNNACSAGTGSLGDTSIAFR